MILYHNPRCRKSREALNLLSERGINPTIVEYLKVPLSSDELKDLSKKLGKDPINWIRKNEEEYKSFFKGKDMSNDDWFKAIAKYPKLMERPILLNGDKAVVGRPPEDVLKIV